MHDFISLVAPYFKAFTVTGVKECEPSEKAVSGQSEAVTFYERSADYWKNFSMSKCVVGLDLQLCQQAGWAAVLPSTQSWLSSSLLFLAQLVKLVRNEMLTTWRGRPTPWAQLSIMMCPPPFSSNQLLTEMKVMINMLNKHQVTRTTSNQPVLSMTWSGPVLTLCLVLQHHDGAAVWERERRGRLFIRGLQRGEHLRFLNQEATIVTPPHTHI